VAIVTRVTVQFPGRGQLLEVAKQEAVLNLTRVKFTHTLATGEPLG
jgi:hypothetical protein